MYSVTKFHTLLLTCYFIISGISGDETLKPSGNSNEKNNNMTTLIPSLNSNHGRENSPLHSGFSEGGLTESISPTKLNFSTVHTRIEEESTLANDEKKSNLTLGSELYNLEETVPTSNHNHISKPRKGVNNDSYSEESLIDHKTLGPMETSDKEQKLKNVFNATSNTSTFPNVVNKTSSDFLSSTVTSTIEHSSKNNEGEKKVNASSNEDKDNVTNSSGIPLVPLSTAISKPKFTRIDAEDEKSFSFSSESDYVIPIVALIFAAPLLAILGMVLYKRSKEFWERRHYRRMDFLIDGMYND